MSKPMIYGKETWQQSVRFEWRTCVCSLGFWDIRGVEVDITKSRVYIIRPLLRPIIEEVGMFDRWHWIRNARGWSTLGLEFWRFCCLQRALRYHSTGPLYCCIFGSLWQQAPSASLTCIARLFHSRLAIWNPDPTPTNVRFELTGCHKIRKFTTTWNFFSLHQTFYSTFNMLHNAG